MHCNRDWHYTNMPVWVSWWNVSQREDGFPEGGARGKTILLREDIPSGYPHWHGIFVLLYRTNPNLVKYQWKQQWLPVDPVRTVDLLPVDISPVDMMDWPTYVSQSQLTIFTWGIITLNVFRYDTLFKFNLSNANATFVQSSRMQIFL